MASSGQPLHRTFSGSIQRIPDRSPWPNGPCGFRDLGAGVGAPTCGCRRFWLNVVGNLASRDGERAWCFCGHHACFHESQTGAGDEALADVSTIVPPTRRPSDFAARALADPIFNSITPKDTSPAGKPGSGLGIRHTPQSHSQSINTRLWQALNGFARQQEGTDDTNLPSTAVPSVVDDPRRSPPQPVTEAAQQPRTMGPPLNISPSQPADVRVDEYSATEVATPSIAGTPDFRATALPAVSYTSPSRNTPSAHERRPHTSHLPAALLGSPRFTSQGLARITPGLAPTLSLQEIRNTISEYGRRLSMLENISFSQLPHEDFHEKYELVDGRLLDLEHWRTEQETRAQLSSSPDLRRPPGSKRRQYLAETNSLASDVSFDSNAAAQTETVVLATLAASAETGPRIDALEARLDDLERTAQPSYSRPWTVQVVLLPFGRHVPGIWFSASESTEHSLRSTQLSEEWSGAPQTVTSSFMSSDGAWTTDSIRAWANETSDEWLSPKACGPSGTVFQRLRSRGFVREVAFTASDAYHVLKTISHAFANVLDPESLVASENADKFRGLREPCIPLRKVRKSTRLRFLTRAEMVTSATWTAAFLDSSVFMRLSNGQRRLYVTTPEAYLQKSGVDWTWPMIKALPIHGADTDEQAAQARGDVVEACWTYHDNLDRILSLHSSFATHADSQWGDDQHASNQSTEVHDPHHTSTLKPSLIRALSLPSSSSVDTPMLDAFHPPHKRGATSFIHHIDSISQNPRPLQNLDVPVKRRRISNSPELERRGVNFTPATSHRFSREPPSPGITSSGGAPSGLAGPAHSQATSSNPQMRHRRGTTPFAYATPHSNLESTGCLGDADGDTEVNTAPSEREWQGVQDGPGDGIFVRVKRLKREATLSDLRAHADVHLPGEDNDDDDDDDEEEEEEEEYEEGDDQDDRLGLDDDDDEEEEEDDQDEEQTQDRMESLP